MRPAFSLPLASVLLSCAGVPRERPTIATIGSSYLFGGEALFQGKLFMRDGCLVAGTSESFATPIFDPGVVLTRDGGAIRDVREDVEVPIGRSFRAATAMMREHGGGWSVADIETFFGTRLPPGCPRGDVIRLRDFDLADDHWNAKPDPRIDR